MGTDPYHQTIQNAEIEAMDLVSTIPHPDALPPNFSQAALTNSHLQTLASTQAMQESIPVFASMTDPAAMVTSSHVSMPDVSANSAFITPMDVVQAPPMPDSVFIQPDLPSNDPYSMMTPIDSPMIELNQVGHASSTTQMAGSSLVETVTPLHMRMNSMLESAMIPPVASTSQLSMPTIPSPPSTFIHPTVSTLSHHLSAAISRPQEEVSPQAAMDSINTVKEILHDIQETAKHALQVLPGVEEVTGSKVTRAVPSIGHLNDCISQVTQKFSSLLTISSALESSSYTPPLNSPGIVVEQKDSPLSFPSSSSSASSPMEPPTESRKRCASELEERRSVKSLKRESPENVPLSVPYPETSLDTTQGFPISGISLSAATSQQSISSQPLGLPSSVSSATSFPTRGFSAAPLPPTPTYPSFNNVPMPSPIESSSSSLSHAAIATPFPGIQTAWSDSVVPTRHHHSSSVDSLTGAQAQLSTSDPVTPAVPDSMPNFLAQVTSQPTTPPNPVAISVPIGRMSRSRSITGSFTPFTFGTTIDNTSEQGTLWTSLVTGKAPAQQSSPTWNGGIDIITSSLSPSPVSDRINLAPPAAAASRASPPTNDDEDDYNIDSDDEETGLGRTSRHSDGSHGASAANDVPAEYRAEVERIFFEFLNKICSNLDATDSKGEPIHQTLMAKKMQRLDESPDFRPFKFRIQAFTHAFLEELAKHGFTDDKIPMKKVRNFLWRSPYILRFNEDGKKAKSKGNHIWNIEAKKVGEGKWEFRPFQRKIAGSPPSIAYCGLKWQWAPHIWDPQASLNSVPVEFSSPSLPAWLQWNRNVLSGTPPPDAESSQITANVKFVVDGQECGLSYTFNLTIAPVKSIENQTIVRSRRPSIAGETPRRTASDSVLFQTVQRAKPRPAPSSADTRVIRVLQSVAQRVTEEAASQSVSASPPKQGDLQVLVKQKHVLDQSMNAFDKALSGDTLVEDRRLAVAAQNVVVQAAHSVLADRTIASGGTPIQHAESVAVKNVTVSELSEATQDAIALAVKQEGPASSGVDIMVAATTILKLRTTGSSPTGPDTLPSNHTPRTPNGNSKRLSKTSAHPLASVAEFAA